MNTCAVTECAAKVIALGFCKNHYYRFRRHGNPHAGRKPEKREVARAFVRVLSCETDDCVDWPYPRKGDLYGKVSHEGKSLRVHVAVCTIKHGPKPSTKHLVAHSCGRHGCANHRHVRWATHLENSADAMRHGTVQRGEQRPMAKLTEAAVRNIRAMKGCVTQRLLGESYGVTESTVRLVQTRQRWAWLE